MLFRNRGIVLHGLFTPWMSFGHCSALHHRRVFYSASICKDRRNMCVVSQPLSQLEDIREWVNQDHIQIDTQILNRFLHRIGLCKTLHEGRHLHALIKEKDLHTQTWIANSILKMYGKYHSFEDARIVFDEIIDPDVVSWTSMISIYAKHKCHEDVFQLFTKMLSCSISPNDVTFISTLNACNLPCFQSECYLIHTLLIDFGYHSNVPVSNAIITAYAKCKSITDADKVFRTMSKRNVVTWTTMMQVFSRSDHYKTMELFQQMLVEGTKDNHITYITLLKALSDSELLFEGKKVHVVIIEAGYLSDVVLGCALMSMYGKSGGLEDACRILNILPVRNVVTWNAIISLFVHHGLRMQAYQHFSEMLEEGFNPDRSSFSSVLALCKGPADLFNGRIIHAYCVETSLESDDVLGCSLVDMYGKSDEYMDAERTFCTLEKQSVFTWSCMISTCAKARHTQKAIELFNQLRQQGVQPNEVIVSSLLSSITDGDFLHQGKIVHAQVNSIAELAHADVIGSSFVSMYGRYGDLENAKKAFENVSVKSVVTWNSLISAHLHHGHQTEIFKLFHLMLSEDVIPNNISFSGAISACTDMGFLEEGKKIHNYAVECELEKDVRVASALINMYGKLQKLKESECIFSSVDERNLIIWNNMILAHAVHGHSQEVLNLFERMTMNGVKPSEVTFISMLESCLFPENLKEGNRIHIIAIELGYETVSTIGNALINMYGSCGTSREAETIFRTMMERNLVSWNTMAGVYARGPHIAEIFQLFEQMLKEDIGLDRISFVHAISCCASLSALVEGEQTYGCATEMGYDTDTKLRSATISMYSKSGRVEDARSIFDRIYNHDGISWTTMIAAYAQYGHAKEALSLFQLMQQKDVKPTEVSFTGLLSACSHAGLLDEGFGVFSSLNQDFKLVLVADHFNCLLDIVSRSGRLDMAEALISRIPVQPLTAEWMTMLSACKSHGDFERGKRIADCIFQLDKQYSATYSLLSGMPTVPETLSHHHNVTPQVLDLFHDYTEHFGLNLTRIGDQSLTCLKESNINPEEDEIYKILSQTSDVDLELNAKSSFLMSAFWSEKESKQLAGILKFGLQALLP